MRILVISGETLYFVKDSRRVGKPLVIACCEVGVVLGDGHLPEVSWLI